MFKEELKCNYTVFTTWLDYDARSNQSHTMYELVGETDNVEEVDTLYAVAFKKSIKEMKEISPRFESYYTRCAHHTTEDCEDNLHMWYDYGSHSRFIEVHFKNRDALNAYVAFENKKRDEQLKKMSEEGFDINAGA